jgi:hypothetical protein
MWLVFWTNIYAFLNSSAPCDGVEYDAKCWVLHNITEPTLELAWVFGLRSYKPISRFIPSDFL